MGHPHPTVDIPGDHRSLAALLATVGADPFGELAELRTGCAGGPATTGHLCVTNWVVVPATGSVLLVWHERLGWAACGGHVVAGEQPVDAAVRELLEETGLRAPSVNLLPGPLFVHRTRGGFDHAHWNLAYGWTAAEELPLRSEAGRPARWFPFDDLPSERPADCDPAVAALLAAAGPGI